MNCGPPHGRYRRAAGAALLISVMTVAPLRGAIVFTDIPDRPLFSLDEFLFPIDFNSDSTTDVVLRSSDADFVAFSTSTSRVAGLSASLPNINHFAVPFPIGSIIGAELPSGTWNIGYSGLVGCTDIGCIGLWPERNAYLGVEFQIGASTHYGWVHIDVPFTGFNGGYVLSYAYETDASHPIAAGAIPESSTAILLGSGTALLWTRKASNRKENKSAAANRWGLSVFIAWFSSKVRRVW